MTYHNLVWTPTAWEQYLFWQEKDKKIARKINSLIKDISRNGLLHGQGKPEALRNIKACSRRITDEHRLIYNMDQNMNLIIYAYKGHYEDLSK